MSGVPAAPPRHLETNEPARQGASVSAAAGHSSAEIETDVIYLNKRCVNRMHAGVNHMHTGVNHMHAGVNHMHTHVEPKGELG